MSQKYQECQIVTLVTNEESRRGNLTPASVLSIMNDTTQSTLLTLGREFDLFGDGS